MLKLERIKDLESQRTSKPANFERALEAMAEVYLQKHDPIAKAERAQAKAERAKAKPKLAEIRDENKTRIKELFPGKVKKVAVAQRKKLKQLIVHQVNLRDKGQCTHVTLRGRCDERRWLDIHHIHPVSKGGTNDIANLKTLCSSHHRVEHRP